MEFRRSKRPGETQGEYESAFWDFYKKILQQCVSQEFPGEQAVETSAAQAAKPLDVSVASPVDSTAGHAPPPRQDRGAARYKKRTGVDNNTGGDYEWKMLALVFVRLLAAGYEFLVASNMEAAGAFDDIVVRCRKHSSNPWTFTCMQLKHKQGKSKSIPKTEFLKLSDDFSLAKYCASYASVKSSSSKDINSLDKQLFIVYTNANINADLVDEVKSNELLSTGGKAVSFKPGGEVYRELCEWVDFKEALIKLNGQVERLGGELLGNKIKATMEGVGYVNKAVTSWRDNLLTTPTLVKLKELLKKLEPVSDKETYSLFLADLQLYTGQSSEWKIDTKIKEELAKVWRNSNDLESDLMFNELLHGVQLWWKNCNTYLTQDSPLWLDIINSQTEILSKDTIDSLTINEVAFEEISLQALRDKIKEKERAGGILNLRVEKMTLASSLRVHQALARFGARDLNVSHVNVKVLLAREDDVLSAWATKWCRVLVVECDSELCQNDAERIREKVLKIIDKPKKAKMLILIAPEKHGLNVQLYRSASYTCFHDNGNWLDLTKKTKKNIVSKYVFMNGAPTTANLKDLVGKDKGFFNKVNLEVISQFIRGDFCFGKELDKEGKYFVTRRLKDSADNSFVVNSVRDVPGKVVLVVAEPGMGKTTLFTHLARSARVEDPSAWVVHIKLNDCVQYLNGLDAKNDNEIALTEFLEQAALNSDNCLERLLLRSLKNKLVVFIDGVDEVCPHYMTQVYTLLSSLKDMDFSKLFVASRPVFRLDLENILNVKTHHLVAFSIGDQSTYFNNILELKRPSASSEECNHATQKFLTWLTESLGENNPILGVPLMNVIIAETFQERVFVEIGEMGALHPYRRLDVMMLYKYFVEKKFDVYCIEKKKTPNRDLAANLVDEKNLKEQMHYRHRLAALRVLFSMKEISGLQFKGKKRFKQELSAYLNEVRDGREKMGIIDNVVKGVPHFVHRSFAEYFVALMLASCFKENRKFLERVIFDPSYRLMAKMFHWSLAENHPLHVAVLKRDVEATESFVTTESPFAVNEEDAGGRTPLHLAVNLSGASPHPDDIRIVKLLARELKAKLDVPDKVLGWVPLQYAEMSRDWEALHIILECGEPGMEHLEGWPEPSPSMMLDAARNASFRVCRYLVEVRGGKLDFCGLEGETIVHIAAACEGIGMLHYFSSNGLPLDIKDYKGNTPLHYSSHRCVPFLLSHGLPIEAVNDVGLTALQVSAQNGEYNKMAALIDAGASFLPDLSDTSKEQLNACLQCAAFAGRLKSVTVLLGNGAWKDYRDKNGHTAAWVAMHRGHSKVMNFLLLLQDSKCGDTPLHGACRQGEHEIISFILSQGAAIEDRGWCGETPLMAAANIGNLAVAKLLLEKGASVESRDEDGNTPLDVAFWGRNNEVAALLLHHGADINAVNDKGETMLHKTTRANNLIVAKLLLENGASVECRDVEGNTPMHTASRWRSKQVAALLQRHGADVNAVNNEGRTPLDLATHGRP